jgi:hypothetical protein
MSKERGSEMKEKKRNKKQMIKETTVMVMQKRGLFEG